MKSRGSLPAPHVRRLYEATLYGVISVGCPRRPSEGVAAGRASAVGAGGRATRTAVRFFLVLGAVLVCFGCGVAPALAAPPEVPGGEEATAVMARSASLEGVLNPNAPGEVGRYKFRYRASATECEGESEAPEPAGVMTGAQAEPVEVTVSNLLPATTYAFCLFARNEAFEGALGEAVVFSTPPAAAMVSAERASAVGPLTATVSAAIDPGGLTTGYHVEIVTEAQFQASNWAEATSVPASDVQLPAAKSAIPVREELGGLQPDTRYRFRFVATSSLGAVAGGGAALRTALAGSTPPALPDGRAYELVSRLETPGDVYVTAGGRFERPPEDTISEYPFRASAEGNALVYVGAPGNKEGSGVTGEQLGNEFLASRDAGEGWRPKDITPQAAGVDEEEKNTAYEAFSDDLELGVLSTGVAPHFATEATPEGPPECQALYARSGLADGFHALFTAHFSEAPSPLACGAVRATAGHFSAQSLAFAGASGDHSQLLFQSPAALAPETTEAIEGGEGNNLYDSVEGQLNVVNVLPGEPDPEASFGAPSGDPGVPGDFSNVISQDGTRVFWTDLGNSHLYMRVNPARPPSPVVAGTCVNAADACTVPISEGSARFWTATPDGRYVFYTENGELWRFDAKSSTRDALVSKGLEGENAEVQGVIGASTDGTYIYFVANGNLSSAASDHKEVATKRECEEAGGEEQLGHLPPGIGCNLYVLHLGQGPRFIAALAAKDNRLERVKNGKLGAWRPSLGQRTAEVSANGEHLVFESTQQLTGYNNTGLDEQELGGQRGLEVFVYAAEASGPGALDCASCNPSGEPPVEEPHSGSRVGAGTYLSASLNPTFMQRWMSENGGRVFFDSSQPLVTQDKNEVQDVYEWEREGEGTCAERASLQSDGGCVFLVSGGNSASYSYFLDADLTGANVFFTHRGEPVRQDAFDEKNDVYDARVGGGFPRAEQGCSGAGCAGATPAAVAFAAPPSNTLAGGGNLITPPKPPAPKQKTTAQIRAENLAKALRACRSKRKARKRAACEGQARRRFGPPHSAKRRPRSRKRTAAKKAGRLGGARS